MARGERIALNFSIQEFVDQKTFQTFKVNSKWFIDEKIVDIAQALRTYFDRPMTINNWHTGGGFQARGFRPRHSEVGASFSQHRYGRAIDFDINGITADEVREEIIQIVDHGKEVPTECVAIVGINAIELDTAWVHIDCRWTGQEKLKKFKP